MIGSHFSQCDFYCVGVFAVCVGFGVSVSVPFFLDIGVTRFGSAVLFYFVLCYPIR